MKLTRFQTFKLLSFVLVAALFFGCKPEQPPGVYKNANIPTDEKQAFHQLNDQLFNLLKANNTDEAKNMMSKELLDDNTINRTMELITLQSKGGSYSVLDEYYLVAKTDQPGAITLSGETGGNGAYTVIYSQSSTKENYAAFLVVPKDKANQWLITTIYGKYNYGWKLNKIDIGLYAINQKNAPELYNLAKEKYAKGYWVDAANDMTEAQRCFHPEGQWQYAKEQQMNQFYVKTLQQATSKYNFPFTISQVATKPKVFRIATDDTAEGTFPKIYYVSSINISDTLALKKENAAIKKVIGKVIAGIDKDKKYVLYTAFDGIPGSKNNVRNYDFKP